jgi:cytochrome b
MQEGSSGAGVMAAAAGHRRAFVAVWDPVVRLSHWLLVATFAGGYVTQERHYETHLWVGYAMLAVIGARILWGVVARGHANFTDFIYRPQVILGDVMGLLRGGRCRYLGHPPAGGAMVVALLVGLLVIGASGMALDAAENRAGPLGHTLLFKYTQTIVAVHVVSTNVTIGLIALHVLGVIAGSVAHRENLVAAMITGRKRVEVRR